MLEARLKSKLEDARNVLVLAVGGGNDSVSSLILLAQLSEDFSFNYASLTIAAILPDCLSYKDITSIHPLIHEISSISSRWVGGKKISAFPEPLLAENSEFLGVEHVVGIDMIQGSVGVSKALHSLISTGGFDTVIAVDVGGDFIATSENSEVMSPMMDSYSLFALKAAVASNPGVNFIFGLLGLGTDGESTPEMLGLALEQLSEVYQGALKPSPSVSRVIQFYADVIQPNRESRTASLTIKSIKGFPIHRFNHQFRNRFQTQPTLGNTITHYAYFDHIFDEEHTAKYYLFDRIWDVHNPYSVESNSSVEWFRTIQGFTDKLSHELNGQSSFYKGHSYYFGTPPARFTGDARAKIISEIMESIYNGVYPVAFVYTEDLKGVNVSGLQIKDEGKISLVSQCAI